MMKLGEIIKGKLSEAKTSYQIKQSKEKEDRKAIRKEYEKGKLRGRMERARKRGYKEGLSGGTIGKIETFIVSQESGTKKRAKKRKESGFNFNFDDWI